MSSRICSNVHQDGKTSATRGGGLRAKVMALVDTQRTLPLLHFGPAQRLAQVSNGGLIRLELIKAQD